VGVDSVSWRIFKDPVSVFVGGIAAVILELAEPSVRFRFAKSPRKYFVTGLLGASAPALPRQAPSRPAMLPRELGYMAEL
jgi:hypothetical protein